MGGGGGGEPLSHPRSLACACLMISHCWIGGGGGEVGGIRGTWPPPPPHPKQISVNLIFIFVHLFVCCCFCCILQIVLTNCKHKTEKKNANWREMLGWVDHHIRIKPNKKVCLKLNTLSVSRHQSAQIREREMALVRRQTWHIARASFYVTCPSERICPWSFAHDFTPDEQHCIVHRAHFMIISCGFRQTIL